MPVAAPLTKRPLSVACTFNYLFRSLHLLLIILRNRLNKVKEQIDFMNKINGISCTYIVQILAKIALF